MSTALIWQTVCINSEKTEQLGDLFGRQLKGGEVFELVADLGGGKTTFVKGLSRGLGIKQKISSPTFTLSREYPAHKDLRLVHYDFYRLPEPGIVAQQLSESIEPSSVVVIEWAETVRKQLPDSSFKFEFKPDKLDTEKRTVIINYSDESQVLVERVRNEWEA